MAGLVDRYGLVDLRLPGVGKFRDQSLQALYDTLIARGMQNRIEAIKVRALIELVDQVGQMDVATQIGLCLEVQKGSDAEDLRVDR